MDDEATFRARLDERGVLREPSLAFLGGASLLVFAQQRDARVDAAGLAGYARRFFDAGVGLTVDKAYGAGAPAIDAARFVVAPRGEAPGVRVAGVRPADGADRAAAGAADLAGSGLALLARRCAYVYVVEAEPGDDRLALTLAAVIAGVALGPILSADRRAIFGVKTARAALEAPRPS